MPRRPQWFVATLDKDGWMDFEEIMDGLREGRWLVPISIGILVLTVAVFLIVAWPQIKPKPRPQAQSLATVVTQPEPVQPKPATEAKVPKDIASQIAADLGEDVSKLTMHWGKDGDQKQIIVRQQLAALKWREYTYTQRDGGWYQK